MMLQGRSSRPHCPSGPGQRGKGPLSWPLRATGPNAIGWDTGTEAGGWVKMVRAPGSPVFPVAALLMHHSTHPVPLSALVFPAQRVREGRG